MNEQTRINRRRFLKTATGVVGAGVIACGGLGMWATSSPEIEFPASSCKKGDAVTKRLLVAYVSRAGTTGEVAEEIGRVLCERGAEVDVRQAKDVTDVSPYQAVILGSAVYMGKLMSDAANFVQKHRLALSQKPAAYFVVCLTMKEDTEENRRTAEAFLNPLYEKAPEVKPAEVGLFAGRIVYSKLSFFYRMIITNVVKEPERDYRNLEAIRAWAANAGQALLGNEKEGTK